MRKYSTENEKRDSFAKAVLPAVYAEYDVENIK